MNPLHKHRLRRHSLRRWDWVIPHNHRRCFRHHRLCSFHRSSGRTLPRRYRPIVSCNKTNPMYIRMIRTHIRRIRRPAEQNTPHRGRCFRLRNPCRSLWCTTRHTHHPTTCRSRTCRRHTHSLHIHNHHSRDLRSPRSRQHTPFLPKYRRHPHTHPLRCNCCRRYSSRHPPSPSVHTYP